MSEQKLLIDFARKAWTSNVLREHSSVQRFVKMTQISVSTVCCFSYSRTLWRVIRWNCNSLQKVPLCHESEFNPEKAKTFEGVVSRRAAKKVDKQNPTNSDKLHALIYARTGCHQSAWGPEADWLHARANCRVVEKEGTTLQILTLSIRSMQLSVKAFDTDEMFVIILQYTIVPSDKCLKTLWQQTLWKNNT